jgi:hypothetical protein
MGRDPLPVGLLELGLRWGGSEVVEVVWKVAVHDGQRVARVGVCVETLGQQNVRTQEEIPSPELGQQLRANSDVLDVGGVLRWIDGRNLLIELDADGRVAPGIYSHRTRSTVVIAGRPIPALALAAVHGQLDHMAVAAVKGLVAVEQRLHVVLTGWNFPEAAERVAKGGGVQPHLRTRLRPLNIHAEDLLGLVEVADLEARLVRRVGGQHYQQAAVHRLAAERFGQHDRKAQAGSILCPGHER